MLSRKRTADYPCRKRLLVQTGFEIIASYGMDSRYLIAKYKNPHIRNAVSYIHTHLSESLTLESVSDVVCISKNYFCQLFREEVGTSFGSYVCAERVRLAKRLLTGTALSVQDIAEKCGFRLLRIFPPAAGGASEAARVKYEKRRHSFNITKARRVLTLRVFCFAIFALWLRQKPSILFHFLCNTSPRYLCNPFIKGHFLVCISIQCQIINVEIYILALCTETCNVHTLCHIIFALACKAADLTCLPLNSTSLTDRSCS